MMGNVASLLRPASVAIVGDSPGATRGGFVHQRLSATGYDGAIYPINPKYEAVRGVKAYASILDVPGPVEFVAVAVNAGHAVQIMHQCVEKHVKAVLYVASGFAEAGAEGRRIQDQIRALALEHDIAVCGPNCYGIANIYGKFNAYSGELPDALRPGPVALVFQSGALTHGVTDPAVFRDAGYSYIITSGNEAVTELSDYLDVLADDPHTRVICCFIEGLKAPQRFAAAARKVLERGKRIVALKVGRSELAKRATLAHTGSVAGEDHVYDALFRQLGVLRVRDLDEMIESAALLSRYPQLSAGQVVLASVSGGGSGIMADIAEDLGLDLAPFSPFTAAGLREVLPAFAAANNPLDLTGAVGEDPSILERALRILGQDPELAVLGVGLNTPMGGSAEGRKFYRMLTQAVAHASQASRHPHVVFSMSSGPFDDEIVALARESGLPLLQGVRETLAAIMRARRASDAADRLREAEATIGAPDPRVLELLAQVRTEVLSERESKTLLAAAGIPVTREHLAATPDEAVSMAARIGYPVVLKIESPDIAHKTDAGCVRLHLDTASAVRDAFTEILDNGARSHPDAKVGGVLVQEMVDGGIETLVGVTRHQGFGPAVVFGLGGVLVEALRDVSIRMAPLSDRDARDMVQEIRAARVLQGFRGQPPADVDALVRTLVRVSQMAWWLRESIHEIDINPLRVFPVGQGVKCLDALVVRDLHAEQNDGVGTHR
jgi:acyl-CoA synthetase (NDP forming)